MDDAQVRRARERGHAAAINRLDRDLPGWPEV
jgi:hypothetical protein